MKWGNLKILLYLFIGSLAACHPDRTLNRELEVAGSIVAEEPDTALCILEQIGSPSRLGEKEYAYYCLLRTQAEQESSMAQTSDSFIAVALNYFKTSSDSLLKAKSYYYMGRVEEDLGRDSSAAGNYTTALTVAEKSGDYGLAGEICKHLSGLYKRVGLYDRAFEVQQKAYTNQLLIQKAERRKQTGRVVVSVLALSVLMAAGILFLLRRMKRIEKEWAKCRRLLDESDRKLTAGKFEWVSLKKDFSVLQKKYFESDAVITKIRAFNDRAFSPKEKPGLTGSEWNRFLGLLEETYGFVSRIKKMAPRLTDDDVRICALLHEKVTPVTISFVMSMSPETLTRRMQRIKSDKMGKSESKLSLESILRRI